MDAPRIIQRYRLVSRINKISGHSWYEHEMLSGFWVIGGWFCQALRMTIKNAEKERNMRIAFNKNHPWMPPYSVREWRNCKRLGLKLPGLLKNAYNFVNYGRKR